MLLSAFILIEASTENPVMPLRLFTSRTRVGSYLIMLILGAAVFAMFYFLTQYVQMVKGYSPLRAGFAFLPISAVIITAAQIASRNIAKVGVQTVEMKKHHKAAVVRELDEAGFFLIRDSVDHVAGQLDVTRYTIYNYLNEIRG